MIKNIITVGMVLGFCYYLTEEVGNLKNVEAEIKAAAEISNNYNKKLLEKIEKIEIVKNEDFKLSEYEKDKKELKEVYNKEIQENGEELEKEIKELYIENLTDEDIKEVNNLLNENFKEGIIILKR